MNTEEKTRAIVDIAVAHGFNYKVESAAVIDGSMCVDMLSKETGEYAIVVIHEDGTHSVPFGRGSIVNTIKSLGKTQPD